MPQERAGHTARAEDLADQGQIENFHPGSPVLLGDGQPSEPHLDETRPQGIVVPCARIEKLPKSPGGTLILYETAYGRLEKLLFLAQTKVHRFAPLGPDCAQPRLSFTAPSLRSAARLASISGSAAENRRVRQLGKPLPNPGQRDRARPSQQSNHPHSIIGTQSPASSSPELT
jgi:hypothetical protein